MNKHPDNNVFISLGKPSGVLTKRLQAIREAQGNGQDLGLLTQDLSTHLFVFGKTGAGMTADYEQDPTDNA